MSDFFAQILSDRQLGADFIHPKYEDCIDPMLLPDIEPALARLRRAQKQQEKILIFGDYDVDGITASVVLHDALLSAGFLEPAVLLPNRFSDGYGMNTKIVQHALDLGVTLVMTVDCGSRDHDVIAALSQNGIDTIVTDHHECGPTLPNAVAIINPKRQDWQIPTSAAPAAPASPAPTSSATLASPAPAAPASAAPALQAEFRALAGVGVAFKLAQAFVAQHLIPAGQEKWLLDLVAIGTICDSMPMTAENHRLCYYGLIVLAKTRRPGLKELLRLAEIKKLGSTSVGFQLGPRLNAAGRMDSPDHALQLLLASSRPTAARFAATLEELNSARRAAQTAAIDQITAQGVNDDPVLIVQGPWHEGVLGIIAGRLLEIYHRPTFVLAPQQSTLKGSARSFGDFNLAAAIESCRELLLGGGGHAAAAGVTLPAENFDAFRAAINQYYQNLHLPDQSHYLVTTPDLVVTDFSGLSLEFLDELALLEPYGPDNTEPVFLLPAARIIEAARLGTSGQHLRLLVWDQHEHPLKLMYFSAPEAALDIQSGTTADILITLTDNTFRNTRSVEGRIVSIST